MKNKKILLITLLTLSARGLLATENFESQNNNIARSVTDNETSNTLIEPTPEKIISTKATQENDDETFSIEQRFMCQQEAQNEGVVCQMYECINNDCQISEPVKINDNEQDSLRTITITEEEPVAEEESVVNYLPETENEFIPTDLNEYRPLTPQEEQTTLDSENEEINTSIATDVGVNSSDDEEIRELEYEIRGAERMCERAETDPREKAICEAASAKVQWRKEKIRALEDATKRSYYRR